MSKKIYDTLDMLARKVFNLADPTSPQDAATKAYVDSHASTPFVSGTTSISTTLAAGDVATFPITVAGSTLGKLALSPAFSPALPAGVIASCSVTAANTVTLTLLNLSSASQVLSLVATAGVYT